MEKAASHKIRQRQVFQMTGGLSLQPGSFYARSLVESRLNLVELKIKGSGSGVMRCTGS
jgi:hypothetical protein